MYVCLCNGVTDKQIRQAIGEGARCIGCLRSGLGVATQCGKCAKTAKQMLREHAGDNESQSPEGVYA